MVATEIQTIRKILEASDRDFATAKDSLNTAWRRANSRGEDLGQFGIDAQLTTKQINFVLDWLNGTKSTAVKAQPQPQKMETPPPPQYPDLREDNKKLKEQLEKSSEALAMLNRNTEGIVAQMKHEIALLSSQLKEAGEKVQYLNAAKERIKELEYLEKEAITRSREKQDIIENQKSQIDELTAQLEFHNQKWFVKFKKFIGKLTILEVINYADIVVMQVGLVIMFPAVGWIFGLPACLFYFDSILTVKKKTSDSSSEFALIVVFVLNIIFFFVHYNTAYRNISGDTFNPFWVSITAAFVQSGINFSALRQAYLKKSEELY